MAMLNKISDTNYIVMSDISGTVCSAKLYTHTTSTKRINICL
jgi:hypothetical protein